MLLKRLFRDEKGAAGIFMLLFLFMVILGFSAIVVDAGMLYTSRRQMVTAADAGALAGAREMEKTMGVTDALILAGIKSEAIRIAKETAISNGAEGVPFVEIKKMNVTLENGSTDYRDVIVVSPQKNDSLFFARLLGFNNQDVSASAVATWGYVKKTAGGHILPIYLTRESYEAGRDYLHSEKIVINGVEYPNNTGYIYLDPAWNGQSVINSALAGNSSKITMFIDQEFEGKPGQANSLIGSVEDRMKKANSLPSQLERERFMYGLIPIADFVRSQGNTLYFEIKEFAVYEILDIIVDGSKSNKDAVGSEHALLGPNYTSLGSGNARSYPKTPEGVDYPKGTILGRMTGEVRQLEVIIVSGDQLFNPVEPDAAKYSKLVK